MHHYLAYGLHIAAERPIAVLPVERSHGADDASCAADLTVRWRPANAVDECGSEGEPDGGVVLARMNLPPGADYVFLRRRDGSFLLRYRGVCDFEVDAQLRNVTVVPRSERVAELDASSEELAAVLLGGAVPAFVLAMRGAAVLHASAVELEGRAIAFVGYSGMGKSTLAALMCADGAALVTDDVLRVDLQNGTVTCARGAASLRLRKSAGELAARFVTPPARDRSVDARDLLLPPPSTRDVLPLAAIVFPQPRRDVAQVAVTRLSAIEATLVLARYPRLLGWSDDAVLSSQFEQLATIAQTVPCLTAAVPWGPPFADELAIALRDQLTRSLR